MKAACLFILLILVTGWQGCKRIPMELPEQLNEVIATLPEGSPLDYSKRYFKSLVPWENYSVIGLGEGTHGTLDFFELKQQLFRFLVEEHHCRILAYEYSYRKSLLVNDYIHHKHDHLDSLFQGDLWIQDNQTVRQFISWMREYNEGKEEREQLQFIGIDNQVDALKMDEVLDQIQACLPAYKLNRASLPYNVAGKMSLKYQDMNGEEYEALTESLFVLRKHVEAHSKTLSGKKEKSNAAVAIHLLRALQDSHKFLFLLAAGGQNIRDRQLARNVMRIVNKTEERAPVVVWAHNAHVAKNPYYTSDGSPAMGWYLKESLGKKYFSVATSFSLGKFTAVMLDSAGNDTAPMTCQIREEPPEASLNALFHQARYPQFSLNIRDLDPESSLYRYFDKQRPMIGVGDLYLGSPELHFTDDRIINLAKAHDLLFYFRDTRPLL